MKALTIFAWLVAIAAFVGALVRDFRDRRALRRDADARKASAQLHAIEHHKPPRRNWPAPDPERRAAERQLLLRMYVESRS